MTREEAKEWLSGYQEGLEFEDLPELRTALRMADSDPELRDWWNEQRVADRGIASALQREPVPEDLEARLLRLVESKGMKGGGSRRMLRAAAIGLAAFLVLGLSSYFLLRRGDGLIREAQAVVTGTRIDDFSSFREAMGFFIAETYFQLDLRSDNLSEIEAYLQKIESPTQGNIPQALRLLSPLGCKEFEWRGNTVWLVCFQAPDGGIVHLFSTRRAADVDQSIAGLRETRRVQGLETVGWLGDDTIFLLVGSNPEVDVEFVLDGRTASVARVGGVEAG